MEETDLNHNLWQKLMKYKILQQGPKKKNSTTKQTDLQFTKEPLPIWLKTFSEDIKTASK